MGWNSMDPASLSHRLATALHLSAAGFQAFDECRLPLCSLPYLSFTPQLTAAGFYPTSPSWNAYVINNLLIDNCEVYFLVCF